MNYSILGSEHIIKQHSIKFSDTTNNSVLFNVDGRERLRISKDGFYVEGHLVANDTEIYEAFKDFLNGRVGKETQDDRYYKAIRRHIEKEKTPKDIPDNF